MFVKINDEVVEMSRKLAGHLLAMATNACCYDSLYGNDEEVVEADRVIRSAIVEAIIGANFNDVVDVWKEEHDD